MDTPLAVLLRNGTHANASIRLALKAEQFAISNSKTPIQIPIPTSAPLLVDLASNRPSLTISGLNHLENLLRFLTIFIKKSN